MQDTDRMQCGVEDSYASTHVSYMSLPGHGVPTISVEARTDNTDELRCCTTTRASSTSRLGAGEQEAAIADRFAGSSGCAWTPIQLWRGFDLVHMTHVALRLSLATAVTRCCRHS